MKTLTHTITPRLLALLGILVALLAVLLVSPAEVVAQAVPAAPTAPGGIQINLGNSDVPGVMKLTVLLTLMALLPALLMTMTCFTRIIIVFSFLRLAMGTQQTPPNQVLIGLSLFLTLFVMAPTMTQIEKEAYTPYSEGRIDTTQAMQAGAVPLRSFMLKQTRDNELQSLNKMEANFTTRFSYLEKLMQEVRKRSN